MRRRHGQRAHLAGRDGGAEIAEPGWQYVSYADEHEAGQGLEAGEGASMNRLVQLLLPLLQGHAGVVLGGPEGSMSYEELMELQDRLGHVDRGADQSTIDSNSATETMVVEEGKAAPV